jgi:hypothetical protein
MSLAASFFLIAVVILTVGVCGLVAWTTRQMWRTNMPRAKTASAEIQRGQAHQRNSKTPRAGSDLDTIVVVSDLANAKQELSLMLDFDFEGAEAYRRQLQVAELERHETGCRINVDQARAAPAEFDETLPAARLEVEAAGHGKLLVWLHGFEVYLDDLELLNHSRFPDPATVRIRST